MADLEKMAAKYRSEGYSAFFAEARVCQDIVLKAISESPLCRNVTIKGGVVMRSITGNVRRAILKGMILFSDYHETQFLLE